MQFSPVTVSGVEQGLKLPQGPKGWGLQYWFIVPKLNGQIRLCPSFTSDLQGSNFQGQMENLFAFLMSYYLWLLVTDHRQLW